MIRSETWRGLSPPPGQEGASATYCAHFTSSRTSGFHSNILEDFHSQFTAVGISIVWKSERIKWRTGSPGRPSRQLP